MDPEIEKIIKEQMKKLPEEIRNIFTDPTLGDKILEIGRKNGIINIEQLGTFQIETNLVMLGLVHPDEYPDELKNQLNLSDEIINNIVNDVNTQILSGIREKLKEVYEKSDSEVIENPTETKSREELLKEMQEPFKNPSILEQKLSGHFHNPETQTDHSLNNLSSDKKLDNIPKIDPYREEIN